MGSFATSGWPLLLLDKSRRKTGSSDLSACTVATLSMTFSTASSPLSRRFLSFITSTDIMDICDFGGI